ncbi:MAG TPA: alkaline phosphatase family protein [Candidatus Dormibacteraeota bacterium]|nr:alkaline phosphatase family protein [Candidatus Dormibacteraeota bacterium]
MNPRAAVPGQEHAIEHVIVVALENRSFDHMLGFLDHPDPAFERLTQDGRYANPGWDGGPLVPTSPNAEPVLPIGPDHSHDGVIEQLGLDAGGQPTNQGFVTSLERAGRTPNRPKYSGLLSPAVNLFRTVIGAKKPGTQGRGPLAMLCQPDSQVPVLSQLAREFAVCTRWFCPVPGETWPNRNFLHAATSDGETDIDLRFYDNPTIFELLEKNGKSWRIYYDDTPQVWAFRELWDTADRHANWYPFPDFVAHVAAGQLPSYSFIEPNHRPPLPLMNDRGSGAPEVSNNQHPENNLVSDAAYAAFTAGATTDFARAETLIATIYEALRANPAVFERSLLLVTYDEHGGFYDHVPPPRAPSPGTKQDWATRVRHVFLRPRAARFDFELLGPRVPALVISPYVAAGTVDTTVRDHSSVPSTVRQIFAPESRPLTARDAWAAPFHTLLSLASPRRGDLPDLSRFAGATGQADAPQGNGVPPAPVSQYFQPFAKQAEMVHRHLLAVGETEAKTTPVRAKAPIQRGAEITQIFTDAARRHREQLGQAPEGSSGPGGGTQAAISGPGRPVPPAPAR